jgi:hypothetical protein
MREKMLTIHEVKDKPKIVVDKNSPAAYLVASKFIDPQDTYKISGRSAVDPGDSSGDEGESEDQDEASYDESGSLQAPEFTDIFLKRNGSFENLNSSNKYGVLYNVSGTSRALVELEFKVIIPLDIADMITGIEILSDNEVISEI